MTDEEFASFLDRARYHAFLDRNGEPDRNAFLAALIEADQSLQLEVILEGKKKVLRPTGYFAVAAEGPGAYHEPKKGEKKKAPSGR